MNHYKCIIILSHPPLTEIGKWRWLTKSFCKYLWKLGLRQKKKIRKEKKGCTDDTVYEDWNIYGISFMKKVQKVLRKEVLVPHIRYHFQTEVFLHCEKNSIVSSSLSERMDVRKSYFLFTHDHQWRVLKCSDLLIQRRKVSSLIKCEITIAWIIGAYVLWSSWHKSYVFPSSEIKTIKDHDLVLPGLRV